MTYFDLTASILARVLHDLKIKQACNDNKKPKFKTDTIFTSKNISQYYRNKLKVIK